MAGGAAVLFLGLLMFLPVLRASFMSQPLALFDSFYRSGAAVFGGGHVVLPLLRAEFVSPGFITDDDFLAGYGAAQALPGPLFAFAAYLGAVIGRGPHAWPMGLWCLFAIFLPAWLLVGSALPFWKKLRTMNGARAALHGANASVVGILLAALYLPVMSESIRSAADGAGALVASVLLEYAKAPPWLVVLAMAAVGHWFLS